MNKIPSAFIAIFCILVISCSRDNKATPSETEVIADAVLVVPTTYGVNAEAIPIRQEPNTNSKKVINVKATQYLGETQFCKVGYSTRVKVLKRKKNWVKIRVVDPDWLSDTHVGWIPSKYLKTKEVQEKELIGRLNPADYEVLEKESNSVVDNYHLLLKRKDFDKNYVYQFLLQFRKENCSRNCNVNLYDSKAVSKLIGVYPLSNEDYLKMADHLVSASTFDAVEVRDWYPYQDFRYKKIGGKNWKKKPIK